MLSRLIVVLLCAACFNAFSAPQVLAEAASNGVLRVEVSNIQSTKGRIGCAVFSDSKGFPNKVVHSQVRMFVPAKRHNVECRFSGLKKGTYAVGTFHDEDGNGKLKTTVVGRPKEMWGVSKNVPARRFGPPKFKSAAFEFDGSAQTIKIKLRD